MIKPKPTHENDRVNGSADVLLLPIFEFSKFDLDKKKNLIWREMNAIKIPNYKSEVFVTIFHARLCGNTINFGNLYCLN